MGREIESMNKLWTLHRPVASHDQAAVAANRRYVEPSGGRPRAVGRRRQIGAVVYPSRVPAQLHVHAAESHAPERAAGLIAAELLRSFPRRRQVTVAVVALGPHAGLTPTPWLLDGVLGALTEAERTPVNFVTIGDHETAEALLRKAGRSGPIRAQELIERPSRDRNVPLRVADHRKPITLLRELIGSSLIVCAPLCFAARDDGPARQWQGPIASVLALLAHAHGFSSSAQKPAAAVAVGHELLGASFASAALILDGTWAAALESGLSSSPASGRTRGPDGRFQNVGKLLRSPEPSIPTLLGELAATDRMLAVPELARTSLAALLGVDRFLASVLGLDTRPHEHVPEFVRSPGRWPQLILTAPRSQPKRLADRAIAGIRTQAAKLPGSSRSSEPAALPARVPGEFAQLWTRRWYGGEHDLGRPIQPGRQPGSRVELR